MIISDYSAITISAIAGAVFRERVNVDEDLVRHIVFSSFRLINSRLSEYGDHVLVCDSRSWRKDAFPYYKANRSKGKEESKLDWEMVYRVMDQCEEDFKNHFPFWVVREQGCEGDDLVAAFALTAKEKSVIVSKDKDFVQLISDNIDFWNFSKKSFVDSSNPVQEKYEFIIRGDGSDGIPNIFADDDTFVNENKRQPPITKKRLEQAMEWAKNDFKDAPADLKRNWDRNKMLIDLTNLSNNPGVNALNQYYDVPQNVTKNELTNYFIQNKMVVLMGKVGDFFSGEATPIQEPIKQEKKREAKGLEAFL